jgi:hypothetical protein
MEEHDDLKMVFTGSFIDASYIQSLLEDNGIGALVRNTLAESLAAGWASGSPEDAGLVFVSESHQEEAKELIDEYLKSKPEETL